MTEHPYCPGAVKSLKLVNFMCHESFEVTFGPRVNFIIGPNGSGKSALLTAIVVVLGGRATTTSRARRINEFVMYGKKFAKVTCVIHNYGKVMEKERAFKPEDYGKEIIIEKTLLTEDSSRLVMKDEKGKRVSERKQELDDMLDHFNILINNPICILNQEISKTFLHSKRAEDKYELFMKATNLETIQENYASSSKMHGEWKECNDKKALGFRMLDSEHQSCSEKINFLQNRFKLNQLDAKLGIELVWANFRDVEESIEKTIKAIDDNSKRRDEYEVEIDRRKRKIQQAELEIEQHRVDYQSRTSAVQDLRKQVGEKRLQDTNLKGQIHDIVGKRDMEERSIQRYEKDRTSLQKTIDETRRKYDNLANEAGEAPAQEIERLQLELVDDHAREKTLAHSTEQLFNSLKTKKIETREVSTRVSDLTNKITAHKAILNRLRGAQQDNIHKYGEFTKAICAEINRNERQFRVKPVGPLGNHIKLKTPEIAGALETHLGKNAHAFAVDNTQDMQILTGIIKKLRSQPRFGGPNIREPLMVCRNFGARHNVDRFNAQHEKYKSLLDHIEVEHDAVFNALVDRTSLESVMFIPEYKEAEHIMITQSLVPRNVRCAYTKDCYCMYPRTPSGGYKCIANQQKNFILFTNTNDGQIIKYQNELNEFEKELPDAEHRRNILVSEQREQETQYEINRKELSQLREISRRKESRRMELKTSVNMQRPQLLTDLEQELNKTDESIHKASNRVVRLKEELKIKQKEHQLARAQCEKVAKLLADKEKEFEEVNSKITKEKELIALHTDEIKKIQSAINALDKKEQELKSLEEEQTNQKTSMIKDLPEGGRPSNIRPTDVVEADKKDVERQLRADIEDNADPAETIKKLQDRMNDISKLSELSKMNLDNFHHTARSLNERHEGFKLLRMNTIGNVSTTFSSVMRCMGMNGELHINPESLYEAGQLVRKAKTLEMSIDTAPQSQRPVSLAGLATVTENNNNNDENAGNNIKPNLSMLRAAARRSGVHRSQPPMHLDAGDGPQAAKRARQSAGEAVLAATNGKENVRDLRMTDTRSLSGGERSFSTVAFILSLWVHCSSPFKLMDEIDVFMDMVTRRLSYAAMIKFASTTNKPGQFIFLSPLELPRIDDTDNLVRIFEMPRIIRKGIQSQQPGTSNGAQVVASIEN